MSEEIKVQLLIAHPENCNYMEANTLEKVKRHIMRTGNYEPLTVRPHPMEPGTFQVINGHHRLKVLRELGHESVACTIWNIDDDQARLYLATLNRLAGKDVPERRANLLGQLLETYAIEDLTELLPESQKQLEELTQLAEMEFEKFMHQDLPDITLDIPVMLSFMLSEPEAVSVNLALDNIIRDAKDLSRSGALLKMAGLYLQQRQSYN
jgi:hypothetical protein